MILSLQAVIALMEMGFDEKEVVDALRVNNNQQDAAVGKQKNKTTHTHTSKLWSTPFSNSALSSDKVQSKHLKWHLID